MKIYLRIANLQLHTYVCMGVDTYLISQMKLRSTNSYQV